MQHWILLLALALLPLSAPSAKAADPAVPVRTDYSKINKGDPEKKYRSRTFKAYLSNKEFSRRLKTSGYSSFENPTGIFFPAGSKAVITVSGTPDPEFPLQLIVKNFDKGFKNFNGTKYPLKEGENKITVEEEGLAYFDYRSDNPDGAPPLKVTIKGGQINGVFTADDDKETWKRLLKDAKCNILDLLGNRCQLAYDVESLRKHCPEDGPKLLAMYDRIIELEQDDVLGWKRYACHPGNHIHGRVQWTGFMHADGLGAAYHKSTMPGLTNTEELRKSAWGVAHEFGHVNQTRPGMNWTGTTEITNNICSSWVNYNLRPEWLRLEHEVVGNIDGKRMRGGRFDCFVNNAIVRHRLWLYHGGPDPKGTNPPGAKNGDVFVSLCPFWQLMLYETVARGNKDFYPAIFQNVRETDEKDLTRGELRILFFKRACDAAKLNLSDYFLKIGLVSPMDRLVNDYNPGHTTVTLEMCKEALRYVKRYPEPDSSVIYYITVNSVGIYRDKKNIEVSPQAPHFSLPAKELEIPGDAWKNAVAYEAYKDGKLLRVALMGLNHEDNVSTTLPCPEGTDCVKAVQWDGKRIVIAGSDRAAR